MATSSVTRSAAKDPEMMETDTSWQLLVTRIEPQVVDDHIATQSTHAHHWTC